MSFLPGAETRTAVLKHPFVLAGVAVVILLAVTAAVLIVIDSLRGDAESAPGVIVDPIASVTAGPTLRTATASGVTGTTNTTTAVRTGPGERAPILGTLPRNSTVDIDGRTTESNWLRIIFPPGSELHGWIDVEDLDLTGDPERLAVATPEPAPIIDVPTSPPLPTIDPNITLTPGITETAVPGLPDLVIGSTPLLSDGKLFVTVVNQGTGDATGDLVVAIFNADESALIGGATLPGFTLEEGRSIDVGTGFDVTETQTLVLIVDPNGDLEEADNTNNRVTVSVTVGDTEPTEDPDPFETPLFPTQE